MPGMRWDQPQKLRIKTGGSIIKSLMLILICLTGMQGLSQQPLQVAANKRYFETSDGRPFFWLGDTGWLLFVKCSREETIQFLDARKQQGFNVIQVMVLHSLSVKNVYGAQALENGDISRPRQTPGNDYRNINAYDYWDHVEWVVQEARKRGIYMALVAVWGSNVKDGKVSVKGATAYAKFLANRFAKYPNIIWLNGGDIKGSDGLPVWQAIGKTIKKYDPHHLMTFHPRGRYTSSDWFQTAPWLDFNMFQSGHRNYAQDTTSGEKHHFGEDNWRFVKNDLALTPAKPTLDGEPSYEHIPQGLHDSLQTRWQAADLRRYAYWSVFAGAAGFTYGDNAIMQFHTMGKTGGAYGVRENWKEDLYAPGASQMHILKDLMLSVDYLSRRPAQEIIADNNQTKYDFILATKGRNFAMAYTFTGRNFSVNMDRLGFQPSKVCWFSPASGKRTELSLNKTGRVVKFDPPGEPANGNDWVLILYAAKEVNK